ncbi:MAG: heparinase II/III family protein [Pseudomonadota bacterium]
MSRIGNGLAARLSGRHGVTGFSSQPQPKALGEAVRGRQYLAGNLMFAGELVELPPNVQTPWEIAPPSADYSAALHGFAWLDDLTAVGSTSALETARRWTHGWIARYSRGQGPGWTPWLAGRRQIRLITHAITLMNGVSGDDTAALIDVMGRQARFLAQRWKSTKPGFARFEALTGYVQSASALSGMHDRLPHALSDMASVLQRDIDASGGIASRNPEELLEIFALLTWTADVLRDMGHKPDPALDRAIARIAPTLRSLRHSDGGLARFHGGGRGRPGLLDLALRQARLRPSMAQGKAMGFGRLSGGAVTLIVDAERPVTGPGSGRAHASTLAFQMTSARDPVIVSCGAGVRLGPDWRRAGRATPSHSTLVLEGYSSSRVARGGAALVEGPKDVTAQVQSAGGASSITMSHDGWLQTHGLTHGRSLTLAADGRLLRGEDTLSALDAADRKLFDRVLHYAPNSSLSYNIHFHLHPDIHASLDMGGQAVSLSLRNGEVWIFRRMVAEGDASATLKVHPSIYLDSRHLSARATKQIVLSGRAASYGTAIHWSIACPKGPTRRRKLAPVILLNDPEI